jgi:hypothetical protein
MDDEVFSSNVTMGFKEGYELIYWSHMVIDNKEQLIWAYQQ